MWVARNGGSLYLPISSTWPFSPKVLRAWVLSAYLMLNQDVSVCLWFHPPSNHRHSVWDVFPKSPIPWTLNHVSTALVHPPRLNQHRFCCRFGTTWGLCWSSVRGKSSKGCWGRLFALRPSPRTLSGFGTLQASIYFYQKPPCKSVGRKAWRAR